jgi:phenylacetate-CoA ligase
MLNIRRPILTLYDNQLRPGTARQISILKSFYEQSLSSRREQQFERLSKMLLHAAHTVPYYRDLLPGLGVVSGDSVDLSQFTKIPPLTRDLLRTEFERLKSNALAPNEYYVNRSGGSTGEPVTVLQSQEYHDLCCATRDLYFNFVGLETGECLIRVWGSDRDILQGTIGWRNKLSGYLRNVVIINSFDFTKQRMDDCISCILHRAPVVIEAYAESIYALARYVNQTIGKVDGVLSVVATAGTIFPFIRNEIEKAFGCPTFNRYGSREVGDIAGERIVGGALEVFSYTNFIEVVDDKGLPCAPGEDGEVLVTSLSNSAMPYIRYRIGDRATVGSLTMTPTPSVDVLKMVTGRTGDSFINENGAVVPPEFFVYFLGVVHNSGWLRKVQIVQEDYNRIVIKAVVNRLPPKDETELIASSVRRVMGPNCQVNFDFVDDIPALASGKYRFTVSHVGLPREK